MYDAAGPSALKQALKPRPELYDELLEAARTLPKVPAPPKSNHLGSSSSEDGAGELRGYHVTLRTLRDGDAEGLFEASNGSPKQVLLYTRNRAVFLVTICPNS